MKTETYEPDIFELNDWIMTSDPTLYSATKYISDTHQLYTFWLGVWEKAGKPNIWD